MVQWRDRASADVSVGRELGTKLETAVAPVVVEARADGVSKHGGAVLVSVALELSP